VLDAIAAAPDLTPQRRQNMSSAVRTVARLLGRPSASIPADPQQLARRLDEIAPEAAGIQQHAFSRGPGDKEPLYSGAQEILHVRLKRSHVQCAVINHRRHGRRNEATKPAHETTPSLPESFTNVLQATRGAPLPLS
jgi:hypothetical protein